MKSQLKKFLAVMLCILSVSFVQAHIFTKMCCKFVTMFAQGAEFKLEKVAPTADQAPFFEKVSMYAEQLSNKLQIKKPVLHLYTCKQTDVPAKTNMEYNLMATYDTDSDGKIQGVIYIGSSLVDRWRDGWLTDQEMEAFVAHEMCHLLYWHPLKCGLMNILIDGPGLFKRITIPFIGPKPLMKNAYARRKEKEADLKAITLIESPKSLATGLLKMQCLGHYNPQTKAGFDLLYDSALFAAKNHQSGFYEHLVELLSDHPLTENRVEYIEKNQ